MKDRLRYALRWLVLSSVIGLSAGLLSALFLMTLAIVTGFRGAHLWIVWLLPFGGALVAWTYIRYGSREIERGNNLILDEIHRPSETIPLRLVPLILIGTWLTHLFGGSAGREGTAVQMGASVADQLTRKFRVTAPERTTLLMAGMSAGFGSVFGVPWAGAIFGIEVLSIGRIRAKSVFECLVASFVGHWTVLAVGVHHTEYVPPMIPGVSLSAIVMVAAAGLLFGLLAQSFSKIMHWFSAVIAKAVPSKLHRAFIGGTLVLLGYLITGPSRYAGLGIPVILESQQHIAPVVDFLWKSLFTILTLGSGMKGGEVTPLLFIGSTFGSTLTNLLPLPVSLLAALGFVGVFAGAANTPLACTLMAMEIFGPHVWFFALIACYASYLSSGHRGIYHSQTIARMKPHARFGARVRGK